MNLVVPDHHAVEGQLLLVSLESDRKRRDVLVWTPPPQVLVLHRFSRCSVHLATLLEMVEKIYNADLFVAEPLVLELLAVHQVDGVHDVVLDACPGS